MTSPNRAERRRKERAEAKLMRRIDARYDEADRIAADLLVHFEAMRDVAVRRGWDDVAEHVRLAIAAVRAGEGVQAQTHARAAAEAINAHEAA